MSQQEETYESQDAAQSKILSITNTAGRKDKPINWGCFGGM